MRIIYCPICDAEKEIDIIKRKETYPVRGKGVEIDARIAVCKTCGEEILDEEIDSVNLQKAYDIYRDSHGVLGPADIVKLRNRYGLSQRSLARLLGWGEATISRYETGSIPDNAHNLTLKSLEDPRIMQYYLDEKKHVLAPRQSKRLEARLQDIKRESLVDFLHDLLETSANRHPSILNGFRALDLTRLAHMTVYFAESTELWKTMLMKLLFYTDFNHFHRFSCSISGASYARLPRGPVLDNYQYILGLLEDEGYIEIRERCVGIYEGEIISPVMPFKASLFEPDELNTLDAVARKLAGKTGRELSEISHQEKAWQELPNAELIPYTYAAELTVQI